VNAKNRRVAGGDEVLIEVKIVVVELEARTELRSDVDRCLRIAFPEWRIGAFSVDFKFLGSMTSTAPGKLMYKMKIARVFTNETRNLGRALESGTSNYIGLGNWRLPKVVGDTTSPTFCNFRWLAVRSISHFYKLCQKHLTFHYNYVNS
jgi:hypothetical protein